MGICPEATVISVWKMAVYKWSFCKQGILKHPVFDVLNFRGWIKLIHDKITLIYCVNDMFNFTSGAQNIENGVLKNALLANAPFANGRFPNSDCSCLWAFGKRYPPFLPYSHQDSLLEALKQASCT